VFSLGEHRSQGWQVREVRQSHCHPARSWSGRAGNGFDRCLRTNAVAIETAALPWRDTDGEGRRPPWPDAPTKRTIKGSRMRFGGRLVPPVGNRPLHPGAFSMCSARIAAPLGCGQSAHPSTHETHKAGHTVRR
jgi:hypothetical protein